MHGAGNDFIVLNGINQDLSSITASQWAALAHRQFGIGADQILIVEQAQTPQADFRYRIFNADGGEVEQCGNGSRCFVRYVREHGLTDKTTVTVEVMNGLITLSEQADGQVTVDMGAPVLAPADIPFNPIGLTTHQEGRDTLYGLSLNGQTRWISAISMGNPHAVQIVDDVETAPVLNEGPLVEHHPSFPKRVNAGYLQVINPHQAKLRVFERGSGETLACGTGTCAAVVAGIRRGLLESPVSVQARGGVLNIAWAGEGKSVMMTGPAVTVFEGSVTI